MVPELMRDGAGADGHRATTWYARLTLLPLVTRGRSSWPFVRADSRHRPPQSARSWMLGASSTRCAISPCLPPCTAFSHLLSLLPKRELNQEAQAQRLMQTGLREGYIRPSEPLYRPPLRLLHLFTSIGATWHALLTLPSLGATWQVQYSN